MKPSPFINRILLMLFAATLVLAGAGQIVGIDSPTTVQAGNEDNRYGILGQPAPALELTDWINGDGQPMDPVRLEALRGKVVYMYFFQHW
jgi:hypothetical protein